MPRGMVERMVAVTRDVADHDPDLELQLMLVWSSASPSSSAPAAAPGPTRCASAARASTCWSASASPRRRAAPGSTAGSCRPPAVRSQIHEVGGEGRTFEGSRPTRASSSSPTCPPASTACLPQARRRADVRHPRLRDLTPHRAPPHEELAWPNLATSRCRASRGCRIPTSSPRPRRGSWTRAGRRSSTASAPAHGVRRQPADGRQGRAGSRSRSQLLRSAAETLSWTVRLNPSRRRRAHLPLGVRTVHIGGAEASVARSRPTPGSCCRPPRHLHGRQATARRRPRPRRVDQAGRADPVGHPALAGPVRLDPAPPVGHPAPLGHPSPGRRRPTCRPGCSATATWAAGVDSRSPTPARGRPGSRTPRSRAGVRWSRSSTPGATRTTGSTAAS